MKHWIRDTVWIVCGSLLYSFGMQCFALPGELMLGGAGGIATILYHTLGLPVGLSTALINLPLLAAACFVLGRRALFSAAYGTALFTAVLTVGEQVFTYRFVGDLVIGALFGGLIMGVGLALIYRRDHITGGSDLAARLLCIKCPVLPFGKWMLVLDGSVVLCGMLVFRSVRLVLYSVLMIFVYTLVFDNFLEGRSRGKMAVIITRHPGAVIEEIDRQLGRGCTRLMGQGGYSGAEKDVLLCALTDRQAAGLRVGILARDPQAFVMVLRATEIWGEGFLKL